MKGASILSWTSLKSIIHPPLPLSSRDSQRLLSLLNTSFKEALDSKHPEVSSEARNSTDRHVHSILASPIFGLRSTTQDVRDQGPASPGGSGRRERFVGVDVRNNMSSTSPDQQHRTQSNQVAQAMIEQVAQTFRKAVAAGTADLTRATLCLKESRALVQVVSKQHVAWDVETFQDLGVGSMMLNWLWSSGLKDSDELLLDQEFIQPLSFFLALEGDVEQPMRWFKRLSEKADSKRYPSEITHQNIRNSMAGCELSQAALLISIQHADAFSQAKGLYNLYRKVFTPGGLLRGWVSQSIRANQQSILAELVRVTLRNTPNGSLDTGISIFLRATRDSEDRNDSYHRRVVLQPAAMLIVSRIEREKAEGRVDPSLYEAFTQAVVLWGPTNTLMMRATLQLHHPTTPSWSLAHSYIQTLMPSMIACMTPAQRRRTVRLGLIAAEMMLSNGSTWASRKAMATMSVLEKHFGIELGVLEKSKTMNEDEKASNTHLEAIDFAMTI